MVVLLEDSHMNYRYLSSSVVGKRDMLRTFSNKMCVKEGYSQYPDAKPPTAPIYEFLFYSPSYRFAKEQGTTEEGNQARHPAWSGPMP